MGAFDRHCANRLGGSLALALSLVGLQMAALPARAVSTRVWTNDTYADFSQGEGRGILVTSEGKLEPGVVLKRREMSDVSFVFSLVEKGERVYLGTGDSGEIWVVEGGKVRKLAALKGAIIVTSLVARPDGKLLAGTLPEGKIFEVDPQTGKNRVFAKVDAKHVWAMLPEKKTGNLFVGTGPEGKLFRVGPKGQATVYWDSDQRHLLSLSYGPGGNVYVGSGPKAIVYRLLGKGRVRAVHDFDGTEVRALVGNGRVLYAAVNKMKPPKIGYPKIKQARRGGTKIKSRKMPGRSSRRKVPRKGAKKGRGGVFRIWPSGAVEQLHGLKKSYFTALELAPKDRVYAADGVRGQVFLLDKTGTLATVADVKERQVLALNLTGKSPGLGTGDGGSYFSVSPRGKRTYLSDIFDAGSASRWGRLLWKAGLRIRVETRTGNTAKPDDLWSGWQSLSGERALFGGRVGEVRSPPGRYFQYRVVWPGERTGAVERLSLYYLPINRRPEVTEVAVGDHVSQDDRTKVEKAAWLKKISLNAPETHKISWKVKNPDGDPLWYRVWYRDVALPNWNRIGGPEPLTSTSIKWKTGNLPDGRYLVRVEATDARANPKPSALSHSRTTEPFLVDNTKPTVRGLVVRYPTVRGLATDDFSRITGIQYSLDGKIWRPVAPTDNVFDQTSESFSFRIASKLEPGRYLILIRVFDEAGNAGISKVRFRIR